MPGDVFINEDLAKPLFNCNKDIYTKTPMNIRGNCVLNFKKKPIFIKIPAKIEENGLEKSNLNVMWR